MSFGAQAKLVTASYASNFTSVEGSEHWILLLQAREYLHHKIFGGQQITPVAIMTSAAKDNHQRVQALLADTNFFGRGEESFR